MRLLVGNAIFFDLPKTEAFSYTYISILLTLDANNKMLNNHTFS